MPRLPNRGGAPAAPAVSIPTGTAQFVGAARRARPETIDAIPHLRSSLEKQSAVGRKPGKPCTECKLSPKKRGHPLWCPDCWLRHQSMDVQIMHARRRLGGVRVEDHLSRAQAHGGTILSERSVGREWCAGCQSWRLLLDFKEGHTQCVPCERDKAHRSHLDRTYEGGANKYDELFKLQGGRCAICGNRPQKRRLVEDHDHHTGKVRGLLCDMCNHEVLVALKHSAARARAAWWYLTNPPADGGWDREPPPF